MENREFTLDEMCVEAVAGAMRLASFLMGCTRAGEDVGRVFASLFAKADAAVGELTTLCATLALGVEVDADVPVAAVDEARLSESAVGAIGRKRKELSDALAALNAFDSAEA